MGKGIALAKVINVSFTLRQIRINVSFTLRQISIDSNLSESKGYIDNFF